MYGITVQPQPFQEIFNLSQSVIFESRKIKINRFIYQSNAVFSYIS